MNEFDDWDNLDSEQSQPQTGTSSYRPLGGDFQTQPQPNNNTGLGFDDFQTTPQQTESPEPKSFVKIGVTLGVLVFFVVILILFGRSWLMNNNKNQNTTVPQQTTTQVVETTKPVKEENDYSKLKETVKGTLAKMSKEPAFGEVFQSSGIVTEKGILEAVGTNTYMGYIDLNVINGSTEITVTYFCNKDTYDAVNLGTSLKVYYQLDQNNKIIVVKVAK